MIIAPLGDELLCVTQPDHAHLAAELLSLFRLPELIVHPRRDALIRATREHDNGWRELDAAPPVDPDSSRPLGFREVPGTLRREIWSRGCERWREEAPYVALLITLHALALHHDRAGDEAWTEWLEELEGLHEELAEAAGVSAAEASADHAWLSLADTCSLAACERTEGGFEVGGFRVHWEDETLCLDPFPLAGSTTFRVACRRIPAVRYASAPEVGHALVSARWETRPLHVAPG